MGTSWVKIFEHPHGRIAHVQGVIDRTFDLGSLAGDHEIVVFDLDGVARITSFGVREWRTALGELRADYLCFIRCHPSVVSQFNLVPGFGCGGELVSFYLPYICPACDQVVETLIDLRNEYAIVERMAPPEVHCTRCGTIAEFDDIPAAYFKYARAAARPSPPAAASAVIDGRVTETGRRELSVKKEIEDTVTAFWLSGYLETKRHLKRLSEGVEGNIAVVLSDLDGASSLGFDGLSEFLAGIGEAYLCRMPQALIEPVSGILHSHRELGAKVTSVVISVSCTACGTPTDVELDAAKVVALADGSPGERCARCARGLTRQGIASELFEQLALLPWAEAPAAIRDYLEAHSHSPSTLTTRERRQSGSQLLLGKYRVLRQLGEGGMGEVLLARYVGAEKFEKLVVLKRIRRDRVKSPEAMAEFQREARIMARLSHPNIVQIFDFSHIGDEYFLAMEYVNGMDLRRALRASRTHDVLWPVPVCLRLVSDLCAGLQAAHQYTDEDGAQIPIIHRDVSPENVLVSVDGAIKLTDFGIAKAADISVNTGSGVFKGKHAYSAPEQLEMETTVDVRADVYAAGLVLYECLTLKRYVPEDGTLRAVYASMQQPPPKLGLFRTDLPRGMQEVFETAIARDARGRYQSAREMQQAVDALLREIGYASNQDLSEWIKSVMTLAGTSAGEVLATDSGSERAETTGEITVAESPLATKNTRPS